MVHNLEKNVKGCFKRRVSITLAMLTIFAITGSVGFAEILKENYEKKDFGPLPTVSGPTRGNVATAFNKTNTQVNSNTVTIDVHSEELLKHNKAIEENKDAIQTEMAERVKADLANENAIKKEAEIRHQVDQVLGERITDNKKAIDAEVERSKAADEKHDEGIEANKYAIQTEIAERTKAVLAEENARKKADEALQAALDAEIKRSEAKDKEHDEGIADNKKAIEDEVARSKAEDIKHDEGIAANKKAIEDEVARSKAKDDEHDKGIADNKKAIEDEVARSKAEDIKHDEGIAANKKAIEDEVARSKAKDDEHDKGITANKEAIDAEVARSTAEDLKHDKGIADNKKAIEELRRDSEAGIASVAAMSVLDFKGAPVGRVGIGAAIGGYRGKQAVAVGMAFAPSENLNFTGKVGLSTDDIRNSAYGVGVNYFF
ncbi:YadA-like domain protein [Fusobacterium necrophorum D12]|uniref:YadA-like family protein n=1 Tax=Fusobacterium necrophorum TaxID=859 RepID=UPI000219BF84|nr:YadA-like family protein [Fusobacterium necrophorum]EFS24038.2 YadA-like domain protein [Fusobacterium necrophorum D12]